MTTRDRIISLGEFAARRLRADLQFSRIFLVDLMASGGYVLATLAAARDAATSGGVEIIVGLAACYALLQIAKIFLVIGLEQRGGDAREFVGSGALVTDGPFALSRNPTYVLSIAQSALWSVLLVILGYGQPAAPVFHALAAALLYGHFWGVDRLVIPHEEAALRRAHPQAFDAYAASVPRWLGRQPPKAR